MLSDIIQFRLALLLMSFSPLAQAITQPELHLHQAYSENRISENASRCMLQDSKGYIWIGTIDGLNRYDGHRFRIYQNDPRDSFSISGNYIVDIIEDPLGNIWVGTDKGMNRYIPEIDGFRTYSDHEKDPDGVASAYTTDMEISWENEFWIAAYGGLAKFNYQQDRFEGVPVQPAGFPNGILHEDVTHISTGIDEGFWIGYQDGRLSYFQNGNYRHYSITEEEATVYDLIEYQKGKLLIGTEEGVFHFDLLAWQVEKIHDESGRDIYQLDGQLWLNINMNGIWKWDPDNKRLLSVKTYVKGQEVFGDVKAFFQDENGTIWASYHGLFKQDIYEKRFTHSRYNPLNLNGVSEQFVAGIAEDKQGNLILLTINEGIYYFDRSRQKWLNYQNHPWFDNELVGARSSRLKLSENLAYILNQEGLSEFDLQTGRLRQFPIAYSGLGYRGSLALGDKGIIWIGGKHISRFDPKTGQIRQFSPADSLTNRDYLVFGDTGDIWALCEGRIYQFDPQKQQFARRYTFDGQTGGFGETIITGARDAEGRFWIGRRNGLECFDPRSGLLRQYSIADGLPSNTINSIEFDPDGQLWLGTNNGLSRFDPNSSSFLNYDRLDGIQDEIFLPHASFRAPDGRLLFGGVNGFNVFHPDSLVGKNPHPPRLLISDLKIFNQSVVPGEGSILRKHISETPAIELSYRDASISFELLALGFSQPQKNQYAYKIEGVDPDWNYVGYGHTASYTGLPRGEELTFMARAANHDGVWNEIPTTLKIYIRPPFWETGWFRLSLLSTLMGILILYSRWRIRNIKLRNLWSEKEVKKQTAEIEHQAADLQLANEKLKRKARIIKEKARQLDQLNKAQARFFTSLSHEFRTPLTLLLGNLEALTQAEEPEKVLDKISRRMQMSARQLLQLISQLMDTAKLESGQYRLRVNEGEIKEEIRGICNTFQVLAEQKKIELQLKFQDNRPYRCWYDSDILHKVLNNLLSNAVKFTSRGSILVEAAFLEKEGQEQLILTVKDSGIGIPEEQLPYIFNRFFQAEGPLSARKKGTGIGLSLVKLLVRLHKGKITVASQKDKGTTFKVHLPVGKDQFSAAERPNISLQQPFQLMGMAEAMIPAEKEKQKTVGAPAKGDLPLVLVVDDNPDIRAFVIRQLQGAYKLLEAADGVEAMKIAIRQVPDLVISDVIMPNRNGFELCEKLKSDQRTSHIPVILLTALSEQQQKLEGLKQGADAYLSKPFSREELLLRIGNLIGFREKLRRKFLSDYTLHHLPEGLHELDQAFLSSLNQLIEKNLTEEGFGIEQLVKASGISRTQLFRKLKSLTGMSASEFIRDFRLRKAYQLLNEDHLTVSEVIYATGFNSRSYFYNAFKKKFGLAPSQLKKV